MEFVSDKLLKFIIDVQFWSESANSDRQLGLVCISVL